jgi:PAS domain S-box-containing protein
VYNLQNVKNKVQKVAEAIATVLEMDVEVVDSSLVRVAGTGKIKGNVGTRMLQGLVNKHVIKTGKNIIITSPGNHDICKSCYMKECCNYKAYIVYPIKINNTVIGNISLIAFNNEQKETLCKKNKSLVEFLSRMADLISSKILSKEILSEQIVMSNRLEAVINSVHEGVIAINRLGLITHFNKSAEKILGIKKNEIKGRDIGYYIPTLPLPEVLKTGKEFTSREMFIKIKNKNYHLLGTARHIKSDEGEIVGAVISLRDFNETQKIAYETINKQKSIRFKDIIGNSDAINNVKNNAGKIAGSGSTVLILGESGTGKELFARAIHEASAQSNKAFISINCGAIPESLLESELFGYEEGAFTGARKGGKPGKFELANGGTIFLDEIGNMSLYLQTKLLRVLQEKQIERVGGTEVIPVDVRIIAATNSNLQELVEKGNFREDLYYRLSVIPLVIPPLRDRNGDIVLLMNYYIKRYSKLLGKNINQIDDEALKICCDYSWPGNIRELINAVEYAVNLEEESKITFRSLPPNIKEDRFKKEVTLNNNNKPGIPTLAHIEKEAILKALNYYGWTEEGKKKAAEVLGISRATIFRKIKKYGLIQ